MKPLETYLYELQAIHATGAAVRETSYYGPLANLLNAIGATLKPKVRCVINIKNQGAGLPDGGLFTQEQLQKTDGELLTGGLPARGVIEVKGTGDEVAIIAAGKQVAKYWQKYRQVLVTNYRDFALVTQNAQGQPVVVETYRLADSEAAFWKGMANPAQLAALHGERLADYLKRVMLHTAPLTAPADVAWFLASYAREAKARIELADLPALAALQQELEKSLGLEFTGEKGERFFRSTLIQTLFYGVFSAWVLWCKRHPLDSKEQFDWRNAAWELHVPMIRALFEQIAMPSKLGPLDLVEVLDWTGDALQRIDRAAFFEKFEEAQAVQYFYEPFLQAFDPELRRELGVWYTPPEIVKYMVARVDTVLREELGIEEGLADPNVVILDPCCGTGTYLVETLRFIHAKADADALAGQDVKRAAMNRVFGFELLPAPFVVAHLQIGLLLQRMGAPLNDRTDERVGVYLTNALTGWEPLQDPKTQLALNLPELQAERDAANHIKQESRILVILGNPPYNAFAGVSPAEEQGLVEPYKEGLASRWGIKKYNLDDLYVRFFRVAERRIAEGTGKGIVCYIVNYSWTSEPSFVVMRERLLQSFDRFWIENMHGNRNITEYAPDGRTSETVFAIPGFSVGIKQGIAISLWVKDGKKRDTPQVVFRDDIDAARASERRAQLLESLNSKNFNALYVAANPTAANRYSLRPDEVGIAYRNWPKVVDLCAVAPSNGLMEKRGGALIDIDKTALETRMRSYFDPKLSWEAYKTLKYGLTKVQARFEPRAARSKALAVETYLPERIVRYAVRPFDTRWCYYTGVRPVWNEPRPSLRAQCWEGNRFLLTRFKASKVPEGAPFYHTSCLSDDHFLSPDAVAIPIHLKNGTRLERKDERTLFSVLGEKPEEDRSVANLSKQGRNYLAGLGFFNPDADGENAELIWMHVLAIGFSSDYLRENADGIRQDWPRVPLPASRDALLSSATLGRQVAVLLDTEQPVPGVTSGAIRPELSVIGSVAREGGGTLDAGELTVTAHWGYAGQDGVTMPGKGKAITRDYTAAERAVLGENAALLGENVVDVYLNNFAYWRCVPARVWNYTLGGYQVLKKWLSYREQPLLGRPLTVQEAREVMHTTRRIAAILLLEPALNTNYAMVQAAAYEWKAANQTPSSGE